MRRSRSEDQSEPTDVEVGRRFSLVFDGVYESSEAEPPRDGPAHHAADAGSALEAGSTREVAARRALAAFDPGRRGLRALAVVAVLVVVGAAVLAWRARPHADLVGTPSPVAVPPAAEGQRLVVTVHDVAFLVHPQLFPRPWGLMYRAALARAVRSADAIITVFPAIVMVLPQLAFPG